MFEQINRILGGIQSTIQAAACCLIGLVMVPFVGLPLAIGGRPEAIFPLLIGGLAWLTAYRIIAPHIRAKLRRYQP